MSKNQRTIACIVGTRPEIIKMATIIFRLQACPWAKIFLINTAQHRNLLDEMLSLFDFRPDIDLNIMTFDQSLGELTGVLCSKLDTLFASQHFDAVLAAGDTTTVMISSLIAFYHKIPFGHVEAGLRTQNKREPFPEEINRVLTAPLATWHFCPTVSEKDNLLNENIDPSSIVVTGNPVIDTLYWTLEKTEDSHAFHKWSDIVIVTAHRRENFGDHVQNICEAILALSEQFPHINFVFPVHPNPRVQDDIFMYLNKKPGIHLLPPLRYDEFAHLMERSLLILTDSGGIQEESPALGKPVIVLRNNTERPAIITEGVGLLAGTDKEDIIAMVTQVLTDKTLYHALAKGISPYGDGHAAERIVNFLEQQLCDDAFFESKL